MCRLAENLIQNQYHAEENTDPISILYYHHMLQSIESFHCFLHPKTQFIKKKRSIYYNINFNSDFSSRRARGDKK